LIGIMFFSFFFVIFTLYTLVFVTLSRNIPDAHASLDLVLQDVRHASASLLEGNAFCDVMLAS